MDEYVSRQDVITTIRENGVYGSGYSNEEREDNVVDMIESVPAADVRPVKRGHWVKRMEEHTAAEYTSFTPIWSCSECGLEYDPALAPRIHFCYNCGADMRESHDGI